MSAFHGSPIHLDGLVQLPTFLAPPVDYDPRTGAVDLPESIERGRLDRRAFEATRYHSSIVWRAGLPACLEVSVWTEDGLIMGLRHRSAAIEGVQFDPESILTGAGKRLLGNFLATAGVLGAPARLMRDARGISRGRLGCPARCCTRASRRPA